MSNFASLPHRVFLTGYRGTGKSTIACHLAELLNWQAVDTDDLIELSAGKSIAAIFAEEGEATFRDREEEVVARAAESPQTVVALGGGAILRQATRDRLRSAGPVVWLKALPETLAHRLAGDQTTGTRRPNLTAEGGLAEIREVLANRTPIYHASADLEVDTEGKSPEQIAGQIYKWLRGGTTNDD